MISIYIFPRLHISTWLLFLSCERRNNNYYSSNMPQQKRTITNCILYGQAVKIKMVPQKNLYIINEKQSLSFLHLFVAFNFFFFSLSFSNKSVKCFPTFFLVRKENSAPLWSVYKFKKKTSSTITQNYIKKREKKTFQ